MVFVSFRCWCWHGFESQHYGVSRRAPPQWLHIMQARTSWGKTLAIGSLNGYRATWDFFLVAVGCGTSETKLFCRISSKHRASSCLENHQNLLFGGLGLKIKFSLPLSLDWRDSSSENSNIGFSIPYISLGTRVANTSGYLPTHWMVKSSSKAPFSSFEGGHHW